MRNARCAAQRKFRRRRLIALLVFLLSYACIFKQPSSAQDESTANGVDTVHGTVLNSITHGPIARCLVSSGNRIGTLTDSEGHFEFTLSSDNTFNGLKRPGEWLGARKPGYLDDPRGRSRAQWSPGGEVTLYLLPEALVIGRVLMAGNEPASGIVVHLYSREVQNGVFRWTPRSQTQANSNGEFRFAELPPGAYKVLTQEFMDNDPLLKVSGGQSYGYPPVYFPNATDFASANTILLPAGETFQADLSIVRHPYFDMRIPIANSELNSGIGVTVLPRGNRGPGYSLGYNRQKQRIEGSLPNGNYLVEAYSYGQIPRNGIVNLAVAGAAAEGPTLVLVPDASINVNVREEFTSSQANDTGTWSNGRQTFNFSGARSHLQISAMSADEFEARRSGSLREPSRQNDDSLVLEGLSPGTYWLQITTSRGYVASATLGGVDLLRQPFVVTSGLNGSIEITMRDDTAELDGAVAALSGASPTSTEPVTITVSGRNSFTTGARAFVYCIPLPDSPGQFQQITIGSEGTFTAQAMAPGTYRVMAFDHPVSELPYRDAEAMRAYETRGQVVHLSPGQKTSVELQLISGDD